MSPLRAIRKKCLDCSCDNTAEVRKCVVTDCALFPFRMGKNPNRKGIGGRSAEDLKNINSASDSVLGIDASN
jgi:hypothetical protein